MDIISNFRFLLSVRHGQTATLQRTSMFIFLCSTRLFWHNFILKTIKTDTPSFPNWKKIGPWTKMCGYPCHTVWWVEEGVQLSIAKHSKATMITLHFFAMINFNANVEGFCGCGSFCNAHIDLLSYN